MSSTYDERLAAFQKFDAANPGIYLEFVRFTREIKATGRDHYSPRAIAHRVRYETDLRVVGEDFKLNNNHVLFLREKLEREHPELKGFLRSRQSEDWPDYEWKETLF